MRKDSNDPKTGNRGEWHELFVLLGCLCYMARGLRIPCCHRLDHTRPSLDDGLLVIAVTRNDGNKYTVSADGVILNNGNPTGLSWRQIAAVADSILEETLVAEGAAFPVPLAEEIKSALGIKRLKQPSDQKADIFLTLQSLGTHGYSVRSLLAGEPSYFNPSNSTGIVYEIVGSSLSADEHNRHPKVVDKVASILRSGGELVGHKYVSDCFRKNLGETSELLSKMEWEYFSGQGSGRFADYVGKDPHQDSMVRTLLYRLGHCTACAPYDGRPEDAGGFIMVSKAGMHILPTSGGDKTELLLNSVGINHPSTKTHGRIVESGGRLFLTLCVAARMYAGRKVRQEKPLVAFAQEE